MSPALQSRFLPTGLPGKRSKWIFKINWPVPLPPSPKKQNKCCWYLYCDHIKYTDWPDFFLTVFLFNISFFSSFTLYNNPTRRVCYYGQSVVIAILQVTELCRLLWVAQTIRSGTCHRQVNRKGGGREAPPLCILLLRSSLPPKQTMAPLSCPLNVLLLPLLWMLTSKGGLLSQWSKFKCYTRGGVCGGCAAEAVGENPEAEELKADFEQSGRIWMGGEDRKTQPARGNG